MALIGAIIGDIIGSQYEFPSMRPDNLDWEHCKLFTDECEFTDDTVMSIATKYAIEHYKGNFAKAYKEFGKKYPNVGYGDMFSKWIENEISVYQSYGNGSAMRVSYIGDIAQDIHNPYSVFELSKLSAECTHNSNEGILGAVTVASIIAMANLHYTKNDIQDFIAEQTDYDISLPIKVLKTKYAWSDTCRGTVPAAIRCFLDSTNYESCIRNCLSLPCDMDTMCCIAGGMAEAFYGTTEFDNKSILQKYLDDFLYKCIEDIL